MSSIISADEGAKCALCGGAVFKKEVFDVKLKLSVYRCPCSGYPDILRIRRSLPVGEDGKSRRVEIRDNKNGERITDIYEAMHVARSIDYDIKGGNFDPRDYQSKAKTQDLIFKNFIKNRYWPVQILRLKRGEISNGGIKAKRSSLRHLEEYFNDYDLRKIKGPAINEYYELFESGPRARDLSIIELKVVISHAQKIGMITDIPFYPKLKKTKIRDVENFLTDKEQEEILAKIETPLYRLMIETLIMYAMRPCEVRALQWRDLDFKNDIITISRHFSDGVHLMDGRKSNESKHYLPMIQKFRDIVAQLPRSINAEDFIFKGKEGGAVADRVMARHWAKAIKEVNKNRKDKIEYVQLYEGTKHSRLSFLKRQGYSDSQLILVSGHTDEKTVRRYAQITKLNQLEIVRGMIE